MASKGFREYPHQPGVEWREGDAGIELRIDGHHKGRILWRTIRAALRRRDDARLLRKLERALTAAQNLRKWREEQ